MRTRDDTDLRVVPADAPRRHGASRRSRSRLTRAIGIVGRSLMVLGLVLLLYVTYLLWGTSVYTKQAQAQLTLDVAANPLVTHEQVRNGEIPPARPATPPGIGEALFTMQIPKIALETVVVNGVTVEALKKGAGRFPDCRQQGRSDNGITECVDGAPWPGEDGNLAISGHRTTYGAPFFRIDELQPGDPITIDAGPARYTYRVREQRIVSPHQVDVVGDHGRAELTLFACHPRFSAAKRIVVHADYMGAELTDAAPAAPPVVPQSEGGGAADEPVAVPSDAVVPPETLALGAIAIFAFLGAMALSDRWRRTAVRATVTISGASALWVGVFPLILRLLPPNY